MSIDVKSAVEAELALLNSLLDRQELHTVIARYPVRETPALNEIAKRLGFQKREQYESAVRKLLIDTSDAMELVRKMFGNLACEMNK